jgi:hypothetical protein
MEQFIQNAVKMMLDFREAAGNFIGPRLLLFQLASVVISGLLLWVIIYSIVRSGWVNKRIEEWMDYLGVGDVGRRRQLKAWNQIVKRMKTGEMNNWKVAILEADKILDDVIKASGYRADTAEERFKQLTPEAVPHLSELQQAHRVRNRVAQEPDFIISKDDALTALKVYKKVFQHFGLLD